MIRKTQFEIILLSIKDLLSSPMLKIAFIPFIITIFIVYSAFFSIADIGLDTLKDATVQIQTHETNIQNGVVDTTTTNETYTGSSILDFLLKYSITSWIVSFLVYTVGSFVVLWVSLFISLIVIGFLTPNILNILQKKYYPNIVFNGYGTITNSIIMLLKSLAIMILLFLILVPFYFIPIINIIAFNIPFFYFFHKMLHFDVGSTLLTEDNHTYFKGKYSTSFMLQTLFLYFIAMIPFAALILPVFYIIYLGHNYMGKMDKISKSTVVTELKDIKTLT